MMESMVGLSRLAPVLGSSISESRLEQLVLRILLALHPEIRIIFFPAFLVHISPSS